MTDARLHRRVGCRIGGNGLFDKLGELENSVDQVCVTWFIGVPFETLQIDRVRSLTLQDILKCLPPGQLTIS
jgi:hypothetical protein